MARSGRPTYRGPGGTGSQWRNLRRWLWASVPVWSLGLLSSVPFFARASSTRRARDWAVAGGYLAVGAIAMGMSVSAGRSTKPGASYPPLGTAAGGLFILLMAVGAVHTFLIYRRPPLQFGPTDKSNASAIAMAQTAVTRRAEARQIVATDPALARDLKIGRPDLQRSYDDGGLVDVNHVPPEALVHSLEWTWAEAQAAVDTRERLGGFSSSAELGVYTAIDPKRLDAVADLLLFRHS